MYGAIIVPLDGGEAATRALLPAARLADASDAPLRVVGVAPGDLQIPALTRSLEAQVRTALAPLGTEPDASVIVRHHGDPWRAVVDELELRPGSLICMATRGRGMTAALLGSTAEAVLRAVTTPVLLVGPSADTEQFALTAPILVCVDGSRTSESILPIAASWSIAFHVDLVVASVVGRPTTATDADEDQVDSAYVRRVAEKLSADTGRTVDFDVLHRDETVDALLSFADDRGVCAVAAATHGHTGLRRLTAGSVTAAMVRRARQPVLTYRPLDLLR